MREEKIQSFKEKGVRREKVLRGTCAIGKVRGGDGRVRVRVRKKKKGECKGKRRKR